MPARLFAKRSVPASVLSGRGGRSRACRVGAVVSVAALLAGCTGGAATSAAAPSTPPPPAAVGPSEQFTPLVASALSTARWFTGTDGVRRLVYEVQLLNAFPVPVTLTTVDIVEVGGGRVAASLSGDALAAATSLLTSSTTSATVIPPSAVGVVWADIPLEAGSAVPAELEHRITVSVPPGLPVPESITYTAAPVEVDPRPPVVLGPPLAGTGWIAVGSCCDGPHRRAIQPLNGSLRLGQRFAVDWNGMNAENRMTVGDTAVNDSWVFYGAPVLAVADATVVAAEDRFADQIPDQARPVTLEEADGNHVVLDLGSGRYAFYAHLEPGSVAVRVGDQVCRGQQLGRLGNSGSSTGPHLHFHVSDGISALDADGLPYAFDAFERTGRIPPLDDLLPLVQAGQPIPVDTADAGPRTDQLPLGRDVVAFPAAAASC